jgi:hypothetical protein
MASRCAPVARSFLSPTSRTQRHGLWSFQNKVNSQMFVASRLELGGCSKTRRLPCMPVCCVQQKNNATHICLSFSLAGGRMCIKGLCSHCMEFWLCFCGADEGRGVYKLHLSSDTILHHSTTSVVFSRRTTVPGYDGCPLWDQNAQGRNTWRSSALASSCKSFCCSTPWTSKPNLKRPMCALFLRHTKTIADGGMSAKRKMKEWMCVEDWVKASARHHHS